jgi:glucan phosphorylase
MTTQQNGFNELLSESDHFTKHFFDFFKNPEPSIYNSVTSDTWIRKKMEDMKNLKDRAIENLKQLIKPKGQSLTKEALDKNVQDLLKLPLEEQNERIKLQGKEAEEALKQVRDAKDKIVELENKLSQAKDAEDKSSISEIRNINQTSEQILPVPGSGNDVVATMTVKEPSNTTTKTA